MALPCANVKEIKYRLHCLEVGEITKAASVLCHHARDCQVFTCTHWKMLSEQLPCLSALL